ncbi:MAG: hypothetical protein K6U14_12060, partial [Firmicutes bacterium]|nr:hypothetical protein [Bacillota bacterium]
MFKTDGAVGFGAGVVAAHRANALWRPFPKPQARRAPAAPHARRPKRPHGVAPAPPGWVRWGQRPDPEEEGPMSDPAAAFAAA